MSMLQDPISGLTLPREFVDEKQALKRVIDEVVEKAVMANDHLKETYYLTLHMKFNSGGEFHISAPVVTHKLPPFMSNSLVFWVSNQKSVCELLWMVSPAKKGEKLKVEFNKSGVAYLQVKGAMPS